MNIYLYPGFISGVDWAWVTSHYTKPRNTNAGLDLVSPVDVTVEAGVTVIDLGVHISLPHTHLGLIYDRRSMAAKGFKVSGGVIDPGYLGTINVNLFSVAGVPLTIQRGQKIAQLLVIPFAQIDLVFAKPDLPPTLRGEQGYAPTTAYVKGGN